MGVEIFPEPTNVPEAVSSGYQRQNINFAALKTGFLNLLLTNINEASEPEVSTQSILEVNGVLYKVTGDETIDKTNLVNNAVNYIYAVPITNGLSFKFYASSSKPPAYNIRKGGWYNVNDRAIAKLFYSSNGSITIYGNKVILDSYNAMYQNNVKYTPPQSGGKLVTSTPGTGTLPIGIYRVHLKGGKGGNGGNGKRGPYSSNGGNGIEGENKYISFSLDRETPYLLHAGKDGNDGTNGTQKTGNALIATGGGGAASGQSSFLFIENTHTLFSAAGGSGGGGGAGTTGGGGGGGGFGEAGDGTGTLTIAGKGGKDYKGGDGGASNSVTNSQIGSGGGGDGRQYGEAGDAFKGRSNDKEYVDSRGKRGGGGAAGDGGNGNFFSTTSGTSDQTRIGGNGGRSYTIDPVRVSGLASEGIEGLYTCYGGGGSGASYTTGDNTYLQTDGVAGGSGTQSSSTTSIAEIYQVG